VVDIIVRPGGQKVHIEIVGVIEQVIDELRHSRVLRD